MLTGVVVGMAAFAAMEPVTAAVHRFVMHGFGWRLHRSHHRARPTGGFELNDLYPLMFAGVTMVAMAAGFQRPGLALLVPVTVGVTGYGACYGFVHEVYIHGRVRCPWQNATLDRLRDAHGLHHRWSDGPYGMLVPVVPARLRASTLAGDSRA
ncbi:MAG: hypothetical protein NVSMB12_18630 [Acidimicrobiales bacterium]